MRYVITLDGDTQLPLAHRAAIGEHLAHPLNKARVAHDQNCVERGYSILQPRIQINPLSANRTLFARIYSGNPHLDPYVTAVSDVYQDCFGEGSFTGKGIYDLDAFETTLATTFPENHILSHDLIEGCHARAALVTDVLLIDDIPAQYFSYARRQHRWVRGDWQLLPWLLFRVPTTKGPRPNPLAIVSRWKIVDNLRRSLVPPALVLMFVLGWLVLPGAALAWTAGGSPRLGTSAGHAPVVGGARPTAGSCLAALPSRRGRTSQSVADANSVQPRIPAASGLSDARRHCPHLDPGGDHATKFARVGNRVRHRGAPQEH